MSTRNSFVAMALTLVCMQGCSSDQLLAFQPAAEYPSAGQPLAPKAWKLWAKPAVTGKGKYLSYAITYRFSDLPTETDTAVFSVPDGLDRSRSSSNSYIRDLPNLINQNITSDEAPSHLSYYRSDGLEDVKTPAGDFKDCLRMSRSIKDSGTESLEWYKNGIGLVKARLATTYKTYTIVETATLLSTNDPLTTPSPSASAGVISSGGDVLRAKPSTNPTPKAVYSFPPLPSVAPSGSSKTATLTGKVVDANGNSLNDIRVRAKVLGSGSFVKYPNGYSETERWNTTYNGEYVIMGAPVGETILLTCEKIGKVITDTSGKNVEKPWTTDSSQKTLVPVSNTDENVSLNRVDFVLVDL